MKYKISEKLTFEVSILVKKGKIFFYPINACSRYRGKSFFLGFNKVCTNENSLGWSETYLKKKTSEVRKK